MDFKKQFKEGLLTKNPVLVQLLGMCSTLAITTSLFNGIGMGLAVTVILISSNILISALRKVIPNQIRIAAYITIIAGFVTVVDLSIQAFLPALSQSLGVFIPLIVVNCIVLGRAEAFASKNGVLASAVDGLCQGIGYTLALITVRHPGTAGQRHLRRRHPQRRRGHPHHPRSVSRHADGHACGRLPRAGLCHCRVPVACKASGNEE